MPILYNKREKRSRGIGDLDRKRDGAAGSWLPRWGNREISLWIRLRRQWRLRRGEYKGDYRREEFPNQYPLMKKKQM